MFFHLENSGKSHETPKILFEEAEGQQLLSSLLDKELTNEVQLSLLVVEEQNDTVKCLFL